MPLTIKGDKHQGEIINRCSLYLGYTISGIFNFKILFLNGNKADMQHQRSHRIPYQCNDMNCLRHRDRRHLKCPTQSYRCLAGVSEVWTSVVNLSLGASKSDQWERRKREHQTQRKIRHLSSVSLHVASFLFCFNDLVLNAERAYCRSCLMYEIEHFYGSKQKLAAKWERTVAGLLQCSCFPLTVERASQCSAHTGLCVYEPTWSVYSLCCVFLAVIALPLLVFLCCSISLYCSYNG